MTCQRAAELKPQLQADYTSQLPRLNLPGEAGGEALFRSDLHFRKVEPSRLGIRPSVVNHFEESNRKLLLFYPDPWFSTTYARYLQAA